MAKDTACFTAGPAEDGRPDPPLPSIEAPESLGLRAHVHAPLIEPEVENEIPRRPGRHVERFGTGDGLFVESVHVSAPQPAGGIDPDRERRPSVSIGEPGRADLRPVGTIPAIDS